ncbi:MAG: NUDIX domain-containing protein [Desulfobacteraceae bacterium]|nr:MAG: NUDIX domain-containing protein [Desulfobacteraceae bacterium]
MNRSAEYKFCPVCGTPFIKRRLISHEPERLVCPSCDFILYLDPKLVACTIARTKNGIVLQQRNKSPKRGYWVLPGGFVDRGETLEQAAIREFYEETGLHTRIDSLIGTYSYPGQANIIIVFNSRITGGILRPCHESMSVAEFAVNRIPWDDLAFDTTKNALQTYVKKF